MIPLQGIKISSSESSPLLLSGAGVIVGGTCDVGHSAFCSDPAFCIISSTIWFLNLVELYGEEKKNKTRVKIIPVGYPD